ncbi:MAG: CHAD domain-containing protein, partial [Actinomycetes bacterium]
QAGRDKPAGLAVTAYLRHHVARLLAEDPRLRLGLDDAVHQVRVATRRLRGGLRTFGPLLDPDWAQPVRDELGWLAGELGPARDLEVLRARLLHEIDLLPEDVVRGNARARVERALGADLETALDRAREALRSTRYLDLVDRLVEGAAAPPLTDAARRPARVVLPPLVRRTWQRMARRVAQAEAGQGDPVAYHNVRIAAKRARYAAEAVAPALGKPPTRFARRCEAVQDHLGEHQDAVVAGRTLLDLAERRGMGTAASFTLGVLFAREQQTATRLRQDFPPLWRDVSRRRYRRWFEDA